MTRIALDWIIDSTPLDELFDEVAEDQYTRELTLNHFVQVMLDVASGHRPSPRAAFLRRELSRVASLSAFYRKLNRMELAIPEAVVRRTAVRARRPASGVRTLRHRGSLRATDRCRRWRGRCPPPAADRAEAGRADAGRRDRDRAGDEPAGRGDGVAVLRGVSRPLANRRSLPDADGPIALRGPRAGVSAGGVARLQ